MKFFLSDVGGLVKDPVMLLEMGHCLKQQLVYACVCVCFKGNDSLLLHRHTAS